jgi:hypothetical protein
MVEFALVAVPLSKALGLSLVVERTLEIGQNILEPFLGPRTVRGVPPIAEARELVTKLETELEADQQSRSVEAKAEAVTVERLEKSEKLHALRRQLRDSEDAALAEEDIDKRQELEAQATALRDDVLKLTQELRRHEREGEWEEQVPLVAIVHAPATTADYGKVTKILVLQLLGFAAGIILAKITGVGLFGVFLPGAVSEVTDYILTGLLIGGGSAPIHILLRFVTERKLPPSAEPAAELAVEKLAAPDAPPSRTPAIITPPSGEQMDGWVDIPYRGGVDREKLEHVHRRTADPDRIVFHHTAMNSRSSFEQVVKVITSRKDSAGRNWVTGYNCVILADGSVHPFCRWDRYGNHAIGFNRRSLGIAFNGNFETDPSVPSSNPDGRMGDIRPTEVQLKAGARVVVLWTFLYDIPVTFGETIIPHNRISSKACPGSQFPYSEFQKWVEHYRVKWTDSQAVQAQLDAFRLKPYLFVKEAA